MMEGCRRKLTVCEKPRHNQYETTTVLQYGVMVSGW